MTGQSAIADVALADTLVELCDVSVRFDLPGGAWWRPRASLVAVDRVSLCIARGQTLGIVGATGSGKSTLARLVMGMQRPSNGAVIIAGRDLSTVSDRERLNLRRLRQIVMQDPYSSLDPRMRVGDIIAEPLHGARASGAGGRASIHDRVGELLDLVGLAPSARDLYPHQFSGGQRQRIAIARALAPEPQIVVLDEPTSALDVSVRAQILALLKGLQARLGIAFMIISHDLVTVAYLASSVAVMHRGRVVETGPTQAIYGAPRHPYTAELLASTPSLDGDFLMMPPAREDSGADPGASACRYAGACALRERLGDPERCLTANPVLLTVSPGHEAACHFSGDAAGLGAGREREIHA